MYIHLLLTIQGRCSDTLTAESGSDIDDPCSPLGRRNSAFPHLAPVHEEVCTIVVYLYCAFDWVGSSSSYILFYAGQDIRP